MKYDKKSFLEVLSKLLDEKKLTKTQFAKALGVTNQAISAMYSFKKKPYITRVTIIRVCNALDVPFSYFSEVKEY